MFHLRPMSHPIHVLAYTRQWLHAFPLTHTPSHTPFRRSEAAAEAARLRASAEDEIARRVAIATEAAVAETKAELRAEAARASQTGAKAGSACATTASGLFLRRDNGNTLMAQGCTRKERGREACAPVPPASSLVLTSHCHPAVCGQVPQVRMPLCCAPRWRDCATSSPLPS
jgi:hypothetical protein